MVIILVILYLAACVVTGVMGRHTVFGFTGHFFLSIIITPLIDFLMQLVNRPSRETLQRLKSE